MPLLDWFRGRRPEDEAAGSEAPQAERMDARRTDQDPSSPATEPAESEERIEERRHEEAGRHSGI